ncbi:TyrR/PhhR family helix-turn-helix DNA-binding protein [Gayadomonas joobiniege]|uniref:TyrR/PhhR family helix-turn-helix DNA-binding protein n=1 Tax=Gayadomonas joobiniege TaxID=1234606 RepID=UPI0003600651|nr:TyrR/PhhR family helix-turn-helix DNA-binding protein [Gayadomonas joobiniege]
MRLQISCDNRLGLIQDLLEILVRHQIDVQSFSVEPQHIFLNLARIEFAEFQHLMPEIRLLNGVKDVKTVTSTPAEREQLRWQHFLQMTSELILILDAKGALLSCSLAFDNHFNELKKSESIFANHCKGFNLTRWLEQSPQAPLIAKIQLAGIYLQAELRPIWILQSDQKQQFSEVFMRLSRLPDSEHSAQPIQVSQQALLAEIPQKSAAMRKFVRDLNRLQQTPTSLWLQGSPGSAVNEYAEQLAYRLNQSPVMIDCSKVADLDTLKGQLKTLGEADLLCLIRPERLSLPLQKSLYQALTKKNERVIISACQSQFTQLLKSALLDADLAQLLGTNQLVLPALAERKEDLADLAKQRLTRLCEQNQRSPMQLTSAALKKISHYGWPLNEYQLDQVLTQALKLLDESVIDKQHLHLDEEIENKISVEDVLQTGSLDESLKEFEEKILRQLFPAYPSSRALAEQLGLSHTAIANKLREYGINRKTVSVQKK